MDFDKLIKFGSDNLADYFDRSVATLSAPRLRFAASYSIPDAVLQDTAASRAPVKAEMFLFVLISLVLGFTVNALIPNRKTGPDLTTSVVIGVTLWLGYACAVHVLCKIMRGRGTLSQTLSATLQIIAVTFVVSSVVAVVSGAVLNVGSTWLQLDSSSIAGSIAENPVVVYFATHWLLLTVYLPLALSGLHGFGWLRTLALGFLPLFGLALGVAMYSQYGLVQMAPPM